jgi:2-dehydro-3-deoxygluconokinase
VKKIICFGEIMLRLTPPQYQKVLQTTQFDAVYGGSEANVGVSLSSFGLDAGYVTRVPDSPLGRSALNALNTYGVSTRKSIFGGDRLGLYFLEMGTGIRGSKVIYDRAHSGMATLQTGMIDWTTVFKDAQWFHWSGITPAISASAAAATLEAVRTARKMGLTVSCDLNYRANLWQYGKHPSEIMPELVRESHILLGDGDTIELYFGLKSKNYAGVFEKTMLAFPNLTYLAMTARQAFHASHNTYKGFLYCDKQMFESKVYDMPEILDRIGGGDAFMAGLIAALVRKHDPQYVVEFATAAATLKHYIRGDANISTLAEVTALMGGNTGGRVSR